MVQEGFFILIDKKKTSRHLSTLRITNFVLFYINKSSLDDSETKNYNFNIFIKGVVNEMKWKAILS